jgi:hypothetical protein
MRGKGHTMVALYRYTLTSFFLSQRYLAPVLLFFAAIAVGTSSDSGPLMNTYSLCATIMFLCATWLTITVVNNEDPVQRGVTTVSAGTSRRPLAAAIAVALTCCIFLTVIGLGYPIISGKHVVTGAAIAVGAGAQLTTAAVGVALGLVCSRLVIARQGYAIATAVAVALAALLLPWATPVRPTVQLLLSDRTPGQVAVPLLGLGAAAVLVMVLVAAVTNEIAARRG